MQQLSGPGTCFMVEDDGALVASQNADTPLIPASAEKLFVAAAVLDTLGPDFVYETRVVAPAAPDDGAVDQLFLVGSGDPVLATGDFLEFLETQPRRKGGVVTSFEALADAIVAAGVRRIPGGIVGDDCALRHAAGRRRLEDELPHRRRHRAPRRADRERRVPVVHPAAPRRRPRPQRRRPASPTCSSPAACRWAHRRAAWHLQVRSRSPRSHPRRSTRSSRRC